MTIAGVRDAAKRPDFPYCALCGFGCAANLKNGAASKRQAQYIFLPRVKTGNVGNYPALWIQIPPLSENTSRAGLPTDGTAFGFGESCASLQGR